MQTKTHWKQLHNPDYLGAYSLMDQTGNYKDIVIMFTSIKKKEVKGEDGKDSECIVAEVKGNKPMILNATNCKMLTKLFSSPTVEDWINKPVQLCVKKIKAFGDTVDALRVANKLPEPPKLPELTPQHERWAGALTAMQAGNTNIETIKKSFRISDENEKLLTAPKPAQ